MRIRNLLLFIIFLVQLWGQTGYAAAGQAAQGGTVSLHHWTPDVPLRLNGEWYFFANELLTPQEFVKRIETPGTQPQLVEVGVSFEEAAPGRMKNIGYASYGLRVKGSPRDAMLGFAGIQAYTSARVYVFRADGAGAAEPLQRIGDVTTQAGTSGPQIYTNTVEPLVMTSDQDYFFLIQVSNFDHIWGGLWVPPEIASIKVLQRYQMLRDRSTFCLIGALLLAAFYNFSLFSRRSEDKGSLVLCIMALVLAVRTATPSIFGDNLFGNFDFSYSLGFRTVYLSSVLTPMLAIMFLRCYFPRHVTRGMQNGVVGSMTLFAIFFALTPVRIFSVIGFASPYIGLVAGAACAYCSVRAAFNREAGAFLICLGGLLVLFGGAVDTLNQQAGKQSPVNFMSVGLTFFIMAQSQIVGMYFATAFRRAEHLGRALQSEVEKQTRDIKLILANIQQGIFTLVGSGHVVGPQFSDHLKHIVHRDDIAASDVDELLLQRSNLSSDSKAQVLSALHSSCGEDVISFETNSHCLVREMDYTPVGSDEARALELDWTPIVDKQDRVEKILVCMRDVTEIRSLKRKAQKQEEDMRMIQEILRISEDRFRMFIHKSREYLLHNRQLIEGGGQNGSTDAVRQLFMNMHTLKGAARTYFLHSIASMSHDIVQSYHALQHEKDTWNQGRLLQDLERISALIDHYAQLGRERMGGNKESSIGLTRSRALESLNRMKTLLHEKLSPAAQDILQEVEGTLAEGCYSSLKDIVDDACKNMDALAQELKKAVPELRLPGQPIVLKDQGAEVLHSIFGHLLRNSLDHGLETPTERQSLGKHPAGTIIMEAVAVHDALILYFGDDGRGLDLRKIEERGRQRGLLDRMQTYSDESVAELMFQSGFSTKDDITEISGRGVGMDAVRSYLNAAGGDIVIEFLNVADSQRRRAFRFVMRLPNELWWKPALSSKGSLPLQRIS
ncbi:MAG TPA: 7TM diverse intracellular signaling domain-containing protein [Oligoflexus sp.]|uniref:7TM diverse intracellular signaling domain-containing protein n=1 Tax=Oligoflexus sp. TaxID=1971216 RepID=UPI002D263605|nr:7TM diverse intracellular signaling domain-containing protein [Oligoflexus sp.]HYX39568.1 7TM diverse intracellular signaling domain-containing protein [Oligoflexus sp.]